MTQPSKDELLRRLDIALVMLLNHDGPEEAVDQAFEAVLAHPENTWKRQTLAYRVRQLHYK